jgi:hypothetical protein
MAFQRVKQFKDIELSYDAPAGLTLKFYSDMPGTSSGTNAAMALAATLTFPATTGRQTLTLPLDAGATGATAGGAYIEGTLYRVVITSTGIVRLFGGLVRARAIGTWFTGVNQESWTTQEQGIGI